MLTRSLPNKSLDIYASSSILQDLLGIKKKNIEEKVFNQSRSQWSPDLKVGQTGAAAEAQLLAKLCALTPSLLRRDQNTANALPV